MFSSNKKLLAVCLVVSLALAMMVHVESCFLDRQEIAKNIIARLFRRHPELKDELRSQLLATNNQNANQAPAGQNVAPTGQAPGQLTARTAPAPVPEPEPAGAIVAPPTTEKVSEPKPGTGGGPSRTASDKGTGTSSKQEDDDDILRD